MTSTSLTIPALVADAARRFPEAPALRDSAGDIVTHAQLHERVVRSARFLTHLQLDRDKPIGLLADHRIESVVALLAILSSGHFYVPFDPRWPHNRVEALVERLGMECLFADATTHHRSAALTGTTGLRNIIRLDVDTPVPDSSNPSDLAGTSGRASLWTAWHVEQTSSRTPLPVVVPGDLAYTIFTSGSTGAPKGVAVSHAPVVRLAEWMNRTFEIGPGDTLAFVTALTFDLSVYDMFGGLAAGACLRLFSDAELAEPETITEVLTSEAITVWNSAPAVMQLILPLLEGAGGERGHLRHVFLSGDWIPVPMPDRVRAEFPGTSVVSLGGATENTIWSNQYVIGEVDPDWPSIPYGGAIPGHATCSVLDEGLRRTPPGVAGDLYVGGGCLAVGYLGDARRTAERFIPDFDSDRPGARLYATGDRAMLTEDGNIRFLGRLDDQVKVRGYRIELGDVQAHLAACSQVRDCLVIAPGHGVDRRLVGFYVPVGESASQQAVRDWLLAALPSYMVPDDLIPVAELPLNVNGKVDRAALQQQYVAIGDGAVRAGITGAWTRVLGTPPRTVDDDFFEAGGDAFAATRLAVLVGEAIGVEVPLPLVFEATSVRALAAALTRRIATAADQPDPNTGELVDVAG
ncbi:amino acid adenylation domain-containing protein [Streptomyces sp. NPDC059076]|uniref:non-ribosomal peptide synthetase n=1 Tax=unclassified Streptomyces TaxID=2593676 RepID=UPI0036BF8D21